VGATPTIATKPESRQWLARRSPKPKVWVRVLVPVWLLVLHGVLNIVQNAKWSSDQSFKLTISGFKSRLHYQGLVSKLVKDAVCKTVAKCVVGSSPT
jgi:anti-sigma factor RsiW